jgi:uncharacterized protein
VGVLSDFIRRIVYRPDQETARAGEYGGASFTPISVSAVDGTTLQGLRSETRTPGVCTVLFLHGNGGSATSRAHLLAPLCKEGVDLIVADYRGYGANAGDPSEKGLTLDAEAFCRFALETAKGPLFLVGHSLGGALAIDMVSRINHGFAGLVTIGTFTSLSALTPWYARPFLPDRFNSISRVNDIRVPWLLLHEVTDAVIPAQHGQRLVQAKTDAAQTKLVLLEGGTHQQLSRTAEMELRTFFHLPGQVRN